MMNLPKHRPMETHCMVCGFQLVVEHPRRARVRGLFDRRQWQASMVCPGCGVRTGGGRSVTMTFRHTPRNPFLRLLFQLRYRRNRGQHARLADLVRTRNPFVGDDGRMDLARLLAAAPFPVYGFKDRPMGLRLRSPGRGGHGLAGAVDKISLGYVSGDPYDPETAVEIVQGVTVQNALGRDSEPGASYSDLSTIRSLIANYAPKGLREKGPFVRDFHRDWNIQRLENTPRRRATLRVNGIDVEARFISWDTPHRVILVRLAIEGNSLSVAALNVSWDDLHEALSSLTVLRDDQEALTAHQEDFDQASRLLRERQSHDSHGDGHET